jgi:predicted HTH transcriptional regulator
MPSPTLNNQGEALYSKITDVTIPEELIITDPNAVPTIFHEVKGVILRILIEKAMTIRELSEIKIDGKEYNPGTIKRHLEDLLNFGLIKQLDPVKNEYGITLKYYRATAQNFKILLEFPGRQSGMNPKSKE